MATIPVFPMPESDMVHSTLNSICNDTDTRNLCGISSIGQSVESVSLSTLLPGTYRESHIDEVSDTNMSFWDRIPVRNIASISYWGLHQSASSNDVCKG